MTAFSPLRAEQLTGGCPHPALNVAIRPLVSGDIDALCSIEKHGHTHPWSRRLFEDCLHGRQHCMVVESSHEILGYFVVTAAAGSAELLNITIAPQWQKRGIAQAALSFLLEKLVGTADTLYLEVRESNNAARQLYQGLGFSEVGERPNYYPAEKGRESAIIMAYAVDTNHPIMA